MKNDLFNKIDEVIWWHLRRVLPVFGLAILWSIVIGLSASLDVYCGDAISPAKFLTIIFIFAPYFYGYSKNYYRHKNGDDFYQIWKEAKW